ncbi:MAG: hypothetical protein ABH863_04380, partial [Candidatus Micrarchaeota archaeon]
GCSRSPTGAFTPANKCSVGNFCQRADSGDISYKKFAPNPNSLLCEVRETVACAAGQGGCCAPSCSNQTGCSTLPKDGACIPEVCSDPTRKSLKIGGACTGCGANLAVGICEYSTFNCDRDNKCKLKGGINCGGATYYCIEENGNFIWSTEGIQCAQASSPAPTNLGGTGGSGSSETSPSPEPSPFAGEYPSPTPGFQKLNPLEEDPVADLRGKVSDETLSKIQNATNKAIFNIIKVLKSEYEPELIRESSRVILIALTDSKYPLKDPVCYPSPSDPKRATAAACECHASFGGNFSRFRCDITPKFPRLLAGKYTIELENDLNESGLQELSLPIGKKASLKPLYVQVKENEFLFYSAIFIGMMLISYALYHVLSKLEREQKMGDMLHQRKRSILEEMNTLKIHYLKRDLAFDTYNMAMTQKQKELTEVNTRIAEFDNRMEGRGKPVKATGSEVQKTPDALKEGAPQPLKPPE